MENIVFLENISLPILAIPFVMFLFLGLFGNKFAPKVAGYIGTAGLVAVTFLSYLTAYYYFFTEAGQGAEGSWEQLWLHRYTCCFVHCCLIYLIRKKLVYSLLPDLGRLTH